MQMCSMLLFNSCIFWRKAMYVPRWYEMTFQIMSLVIDLSSYFFLIFRCSITIAAKLLNIAAINKLIKSINTFDISKKRGILKIEKMFEQQWHTKTLKQKNKGYHNNE